MNHQIRERNIKSINYRRNKITYLFVALSRIYVDLPDAQNRMKILKIFLAQENLEPGFELDKLANATEGYSGSDLKVWSHNMSEM